MAVGHLRHDVRCGRRDDDQIGLARETDMADIEFVIGIEQIGKHALAGNGAGRQRRDEFLGRLGEDAAHLKPALLQPPDQIERFIRGNAAANDQQNALWRGGRFRRQQARRWDGGGLGVAGGLAENGAHFILNRPAMTRRAQPQLLLQGVVDLTDGERGHKVSMCQ